MPKKPLPAHPQPLFALIESFDQTSYISTNREHQNPVDDEALIEKIERARPPTPLTK